jgi:hypothetical protein
VTGTASSPRTSSMSRGRSTPAGPDDLEIANGGCTSKEIER